MLQRDQTILRIVLIAVLLIIGYVISSRWLTSGTSRRAITYTIPTSVYVAAYMVVVFALWWISQKMNTEGFSLQTRYPREVTILYTDRYAHSAMEAKDLLSRFSIPTNVQKSHMNDVVVLTMCGDEFLMSEDDVLDTEADFSAQNIKYFVMKTIHPSEGPDPIPERIPIWPVLRNCSSS